MMSLISGFCIWAHLIRASTASKEAQRRRMKCNIQRQAQDTQTPWLNGLLLLFTKLQDYTSNVIRPERDSHTQQTQLHFKLDCLP